MILSPSILAADCLKLGESIAEVEEAGAEYLHIDVMDGTFVPNLSFGVPIVEACRKGCNMVLDVHLMIEEPERYIDKFADAGADIITIHYEACKPIRETIEKIKARGLKAGVSIKPGTDVEVLKDLFDITDMFLIMTVEPGFGGQKYMEICTDKIKNLRGMLTEASYNTDIEVDGGITKENISVVLDAGANVIVMGSSVFKGDIKENIEWFRKNKK